MAHRIRAAVLTILSSIVLTAGCSPFVENNTIEEIAPVIFWYVTEGEEGKIKISTLVPPLINEKKRLLSMEVNLVKQAEKQFNLIYYRELKAGQTRMILINEELAKKGIMSLINTLIIDPEISPRLYLVIVKGDVEHYIKTQMAKQANFDYFFYRMLRHYEKYNQGEMSIVNLHQFLKRLYSPYSFPIMPVFHVSKDNFIYEGTAFFSSDTLKATDTAIDDQIFQLLDNDHFLKLLAIPALSTTLGRVRADTHMKVERNYASLSISVQLTGRIEEYRGEKNLLLEDQLKSHEEEIENYLEKQTATLLRKMQKWKVDPLQIGAHTLPPFTKPITEKEWLRHWEEMKINVNVDYKLRIQTLTNVKK